jgi:hypothetical protein
MKLFNILLVLATITTAKSSFGSVDMTKNAATTPAAHSVVPPGKEEGGCPLNKSASARMLDNTAYAAGDAKAAPVHGQIGADAIHR